MTIRLLYSWQDYGQTLKSASARPLRVTCVDWHDNQMSDSREKRKHFLPLVANSSVHSHGNDSNSDQNLSSSKTSYRRICFHFHWTLKPWKEDNALNEALLGGVDKIWVVVILRMVNKLSASDFGFSHNIPPSYTAAIFRWKIIIRALKFSVY